MDVVVANLPFSVAPIFCFHSTPLYNFITGNGMFSAYPKITCEHQGLFNPCWFTLNQFAPALPPTNVRHALFKYVTHGFDIRQNPASWPDDNHTCTVDKNCPHTTCNVEDSRCIFVTFWVVGENNCLNMKTHLVSRDICNGEGYCTFWHLGGRSCDGQKPRAQGFITCWPEYKRRRIINID